MAAKFWSSAACCMLLLSLASVSASETAVSRCSKYVRVVRAEAIYAFGLSAPVSMFLGQFETESGCREGITAFDGGAGLGQFMPSTAEWIQEVEPGLQEIASSAMPYDSRWAIRATILYDKRLYRGAKCTGWYYALRAYNGGLGMLHKEIARAGTCDQAAVEEACQRKILKLKSGPLSLCEVNIKYPVRIFKAAENYGRMVWNPML